MGRGKCVMGRGGGGGGGGGGGEQKVDVGELQARDEGRDYGRCNGLEPYSCRAVNLPRGK